MKERSWCFGRGGPLDGYAAFLRSREVFMGCASVSIDLGDGIEDVVWLGGSTVVIEVGKGNG